MKIQEIKALTEIIGSLKVPALGIESMRGVIRLNKNLGLKNEEFNELQQAVLKEYNVEADENGRYDWTKNKKSEEITKKLQDLTDLDFGDAEPLNFMKDTEFFESVKELSVNQITAMYDYLVENEDKDTSKAPKKSTGKKSNAKKV